MSTFTNVVSDLNKKEDKNAETPEKQDASQTEKDVAANSPADEVTKINNDESVEDRKSHNWDKLLSVRISGNGTYFLDIDPSIMDDETVKKFWKENATGVGAKVDVGILDSIMNFLKSIINKIIKVISGREGDYFHIKGSRDIRIQSPTEEGAYALKNLLISQFEEQAKSVNKSLNAMADKDGVIDSAQAMNMLNAKADNINKLGKTEDFALVTPDEASFYVESFNEHLSRKAAADDAVAAQIAKSPKIVSALMAAYPAMFSGQSKMVEKALEKMVAGEPHKASKAVELQVTKILAGSYNLHEHALKSGKVDETVAQALRDNGSLDLSNALAKRQMLTVFDSKFSTANVNSLAARANEAKDRLPAELIQSLNELKARAAVPHFVHSEKDARWFERRKTDVENGIKPDEKRVGMSIGAAVAAVSEQTKGKTLQEPIDKHQQVFEKALKAENPIKYVLSLPRTEKEDFFKSIATEHQILRAKSLPIDPWTLSESGEFGQVEDSVFDSVQNEFRQALPGPRDNGVNSHLRGNYEILTYYAGLALYEDMKQQPEEDYAQHYQEAIERYGNQASSNNETRQRVSV